MLLDKPPIIGPGNLRCLLRGAVCKPSKFCLLEGQGVGEAFYGSHRNCVCVAYRVGIIASRLARYCLWVRNAVR